MTLRCVRIAVAALAVGCAIPSCASDPTDPPVVILPATKVTLTTSDGRRHVYIAEVARTSEQQARGLMFRRKMARDAGMIFPMKPARPSSFWMENTYLPLDIIFIGAGNEVLNITYGKPLSTDTVDSLGPASAVLELNAGEAKRIGLKPGDKISY